MRNQLARIIYPFIEAAGELYGQTPCLLRHLIQTSTAGHSELRDQISDVFHAVSSVIPRINDLISADSTAMSEGIIIQAVYIAIGPFFVADGTVDSRGKEKKDSLVGHTLGSSAMRGLRLDALSLIRSVSGHRHAGSHADSRLDFCQPRGPKELDYRRNTFIVDQALRYKTEGGPIPVRLKFLIPNLHH